MSSAGELTIIQGSTNSFVFEWVGSDGNPVDVSTGYTAQMQARVHESSATTLFDLTSAGGDITLEANGKITAKLDAADSAALNFTRAVYDLTLTKIATGEKYRLVKDRVVLDRSVTR